MGVDDKQRFLDAVQEEFGAIPDVISRPQVVDICARLNIKLPAWLTNDPAIRVGRGLYSLKGRVAKPHVPKNKENVAAAAFQAPVRDDAIMTPSASPTLEEFMSASDASLVPDKQPGYVPFGNWFDLLAIIRTKKFFTSFTTGPTGNGKTTQIEQVCAVLGRECIRVNITRETDEDDLLGGFRMIKGETVWQNGPVVIAMQRGAVLLLDEIDLGDNKIMCLQPVLEGKPIYLKKINKVIYPAAGFTAAATANTKGKGSSDGRYIGTNVMNEALLDRFSITFEQHYPEEKTEKKIIRNLFAQNFDTLTEKDEQIVETLVKWANVVRETFFAGNISEVISTRRLVHISEAYSIFERDLDKAVAMCLTRYDTDTQAAFATLLKMITDPGAAPVEAAAPAAPETPAF